MPKTYTQEQIDHAIATLESWVGQRLEHHGPVRDAPVLRCDDDSDIDGLISDAWCGVDYHDFVYEALEAAARLREGKLPGTPEWYDEDDTSDEDEANEIDDGEDLEE